MTITVTLRYGARLSLTKEVPTGTTVGTIMRDASVRAGLQLPENCSATVDGRTLSSGDRLNDGDVVQFEKQAAQKAV